MLSVLKAREGKGGRELQIVWSFTWVPETDVPEHLVDRFDSIEREREHDWRDQGGEEHD